MSAPYWSDDAVTLWHGDALALPLEDATVDLVVTSPPYFGLRSYQDGGEHYAGQIGSEATPAEFVDALIAATREMVRVLKPSGSIWVNLGDKYASTSTPGPQSQHSTMTGGRHKGVDDVLPRRLTPGAPPKSLIGIPARYMLRCIDDLGLILRAEVIWSKPNGLPESVTDRVRRSHEVWFSFQKSGGVEAQSHSFPFCPLCGRPVNARSTLVARLKELDGSVESVGVADEVGADDVVQANGIGPNDGDVKVGPDRSPIPELVEVDARGFEDGVNLADDLGAAVVDADAEMRSPVTPVAQGDSSLAVDDASEPSKFCECVGHPLIIDDEPWLPQSATREILEGVIAGDVDPQRALDYLNGDGPRSHSVWFHFTKSPRYYSAVDEIREAHVTNDAVTRIRTSDYAGVMSGAMNGAGNPLGKLPGSVWTIATQPLTVPASLGIDHFAAFPFEFPRRIITGWSPREVCTACGEGRRPVAGKAPWWEDYKREHGIGDYLSGSYTPGEGYDQQAGRQRANNGASIPSGPKTVITGYACACPDTTAPTTPGVVLDPFSGTGTTALMAKVLGRRGIGVDLSADYCRLARWRVNDPGQIASAMQVEKVAPPIDDQGVLDFEGWSA